MTWRTTLSAIVADASITQVLLIDGKLPTVTGEIFAAQYGKMATALEQVIGVKPIILRLLNYNIDRETREITIAVHGALTSTQAHQLDQLHPIEALAGTITSTAFLNAAVAQFKRLIKTDSNEAPWTIPSWYHAAFTWIETSLENAGYTLTGPIQQFKIWGVGCVMHVETDKGKVWFKACRTLPLFANEAEITAKLATAFPNDIPAPIAIDVDRNWLLTPHVGNSLNTPPTPTANGDAYLQLARLQKQTIGRTAEFEAMGCLNRRLDWLQAQFVPLLNRIEHNHPDLSDLVLAARKQLPNWKLRLQRMQALPFPDTLIHGDFHVGNVFGNQSPFSMLDWSDASISHPLIDLQAILYFAEEKEWADFLAPWFAEWGIDNWLPIVKLARPIIGLFHLLSFEQILANVAPNEASLYVDDIQWYLEKITLDDFKD